MADSNKILPETHDVVQGDLLDGPEGDCGGAPLPLGKAVSELAAEQGAGGRGPGRPLGAKNKKTLTLQKWLLSLGYQHPAVILSEIAARPVAELAKVLNCKKLEAFQEQRKAASDLLPYFEGKILPKTDDGEQPLPQLHLHLDVDQVTLAGKKPVDDGPIIIAQKIEEKQQLNNPTYSVTKSDDDEALK